MVWLMTKFVGARPMGVVFSIHNAASWKHIYRVWTVHSCLCLSVCVVMRFLSGLSTAVCLCVCWQSFSMDCPQLSMIYHNSTTLPVDNAAVEHCAAQIATLCSTLSEYPLIRYQSVTLLLTTGCHSGWISVFLAVHYTWFKWLSSVTEHQLTICTCSAMTDHAQVVSWCSVSNDNHAVHVLFSHLIA